MNINNHAFAIVQFANELRTAESPAPDPSDLTHSQVCRLRMQHRNYWLRACFLFSGDLECFENGLEEWLFCRLIKSAHFNPRCGLY